MVDGCLYAKSNNDDVEFIVINDLIKTANNKKSVLLSQTEQEIRAEFSPISIVKNQYDENLHYLIDMFDQHQGVRFNIADNRVIEVVYGDIQELQFQEGCA